MQVMLSRVILVCFLTLFPILTHAWNALGHMVVANIAYEQLQPDVRNKVDALVSYMQQQYTNTDSFLKMAYWPDAIRTQKIETFTHWHYIDYPFTTDGSPLKNTIDTDNGVWALNHIKVIVKNTHANPYERTRFLAFLVHIVGDLHQPLHSVTLISKNHPDGDRGGNEYFVRYNNERIRLHTLWDSGLAIFDKNNTKEKAQALSAMITAAYPRNAFNKEIEDVDPEHWAKESAEVAQKNAYNTPENQALSNQYIKTNTALAERQIALAGYRLANLLNQLLA